MRRHRPLLPCLLLFLALQALPVLASNVTQVKRMRDFATQGGPTLTTDWNDTANNVLGLNSVGFTRAGDKDGDGVADAPDSVTQRFDALGRIVQGVDAHWYPVGLHVCAGVCRH